MTGAHRIFGLRDEAHTALFGAETKEVLGGGFADVHSSEEGQSCPFFIHSHRVEFSPRSLFSTIPLALQPCWSDRPLI